MVYDQVVGKAVGPVMEDGDPQAGVSAGDRGLATGVDDAETEAPGTVGRTGGPPGTRTQNIAD